MTQVTKHIHTHKSTEHRLQRSPHFSTSSDKASLPMLSKHRTQTQVVKQCIWLVQTITVSVFGYLHTFVYDDDEFGSRLTVAQGELYTSQSHITRCAAARQETCTVLVLGNVAASCEVKAMHEFDLKKFMDSFSITHIKSTTDKLINAISAELFSTKSRFFSAPTIESIITCVWSFRVEFEAYFKIQYPSF